jgi:hypothetical protein
MKLFETYRYAKPSPGPDVEMVDGYRNLFNATRWPAWPGLVGAGRVQLDHGIDSVTRVNAVDGGRRPAILIASKPHQAGSDWTPWHDELNPDVGHVRYFGDNKATRGSTPLDPPGNRAVKDEFRLYRAASVADRMRAAPMLFFESVPTDGREKGFWRFIGFGIVERAELSTQIDRQDRLFVNFVFDCVLFDLAAESNELPWEWIAARRDPTMTLLASHALAPESWRRWVNDGERAIERVRQRLNRVQLVNQGGQRPQIGTPAEAALNAVVAHYKHLGGYEGVGEHRFEGLASEVVGSYLRESGQYRPGWITKRAGDGGIDFVSRLDIGVGSGSLKLVVLGQAKCVSPSAPPTSGLDLARTVSRLDRGWVGAFVTTGFFSEQAQREVQTDRFPLLMLNGRHVGEAVVKEAAIRGESVPDYLDAVNLDYDRRLSSRLPIEVLSD